MKMIACRCPSCGANLQIEEGKKKVFCTYCGTPILVDDENRTVTYRTVDEARIREAEARENIAGKQMDITRLKIIIAGAIAGVMLLFLVIIFFTDRDSFAIITSLGFYIIFIGLIVFGARNMDKNKK